LWIGEQQQATGILVLVSAFMCGGLRSNDSIEISASFLCVCAAQHSAELLLMDLVPDTKYFFLAL
jgi:hypothetical protein